MKKRSWVCQPRLGFRWPAVAILLWFAAFGLFGAAGQNSSGPLLLQREQAGVNGEVQGVVLPNPTRIAAVVLWPVGSGDAGEAASMVAASAVLESAVGNLPDARPIIECGPGFWALGAELPAARGEDLLGILARLATPSTPAFERLSATARKLEVRQGERWNDPLYRARAAALGLLWPGRAGFCGDGLSPASFASALPQVAGFLSTARRGMVEIRFAGPAGFAGQVQRALANRLGPLAEFPAFSEAARLPLSAVVNRSSGNVHLETVGETLAFRLSAEEAHVAGPPLAVLVEALREGPGSLVQRLRVAIKDPVPAQIDFIPSPGGGGVLLIGARAPRAAATATWRVLEGTVSSVGSLPMKEEALYRARQRLDEASQNRGLDAAGALRWFLKAQPWEWPPEDRWERPVTAAEVRQAARKLFSMEDRTAAAAGAVPDDLVGANGLFEPVRVNWEEFDPQGENLKAANGGGAALESRQLAQEILHSLSSRGKDDPLPGFSARYQVQEETPLGPAEMELTVESGLSGTAVHMGTQKWTLTARGKSDGGEAELPHGNGSPAQLPVADRLPAVVLREPVYLADAVIRGELPASAVQTRCGQVACRGLRVEMAEGTVLLLSLDPETGRPVQLRSWYEGGDAKRPPDEEVDYSVFVAQGRVQVAAQFKIRDHLGTQRTLRLLDWKWKEAPPGNGK